MCVLLDKATAINLLKLKVKCMMIMLMSSVTFYKSLCPLKLSVSQSTNMAYEIDYPNVLLTFNGNYLKQL